ncbi:MAG: protein tyrosine phosphatase [Fibrobacteria bacterium]|nr:protein tyrosine phosphatase [Fibrobacteria bacterium]
MARPVRVLFVCMGNICRSPVAEGIFLHLVKERGLSERFEVDSCGIGDWHIGHSADPRSQDVARRNGIELACTSRQVDRNRDFEYFDWIIAMDRQNLRDLLHLSPEEHQRKIHLMREFDDQIGERETDEVPDPYYGGPQGFDTMYAMLRRSCENFLDSLAPAKR